MPTPTAMADRLTVADRLKVVAPIAVVGRVAAGRCLRPRRDRPAFSPPSPPATVNDVVATGPHHCHHRCHRPPSLLPATVALTIVATGHRRRSSRLHRQRPLCHRNQHSSVRNRKWADGGKSHLGVQEGGAWGGVCRHGHVPEDGRSPRMVAAATPPVLPARSSAGIRRLKRFGSSNLSPTELVLFPVEVRAHMLG